MAKMTVDELFDSLGERPWYLLEKENPGDVAPGAKVGRDICRTVQDIEQRQTSIFEGNRRHARIYSGYLPSGLAWGANNTSVRNPFPATKGIIRSICDTATALIVRSRPRAAFITDGADWNTATQAEDLEQFCMGAYDQAGIYDVAPRAFHDSTVFGTGAWKYVPRGDGDKFVVKTERVLMDDLIVDEEECRTGLEPQNTYHRMYVRADKLLVRYGKNNPELVKAIRGAVNSKWPQRNVPTGCVVIVEAIHVDCDNPANNRQVLAGEGFVLKDVKWPYPWHPYTFLWWTHPLSGFYGDGIAYRQYGRQERINYMYRWIQRCHDLFATPRAWVDPAGGPPTSQMSTEIGQIIAARKPPIFQTQESINAEIYRWLDNLERGGYEDEGISQSSAQNELPPGIESAPAQREHSFKEGQRFAPVSQRWENALAAETATKMVAMYRHYANTSKEKPRVKWADRKMLYTIDWPDLAEDAYMIRPEAASLESLSPAARLQSALELAQTGWLRPGEGRALVGHPDLRRADEFGNAGEDYAFFVYHELIRGKVLAVDDKADLAALDRIIRAGRLLAKKKKAPQNILDNLDHYLEDLDVIQQEVQASLMQQQMPGNMAPPTNEAVTPFQ